MNKQVLSIAQMKNLSKLMPLKERTDFIWWGKGEGADPDKYKWELHCSDTADANPQCDWIYPAYTLQDILDILPAEINVKGERNWLCIDMGEEWVCYYHEYAGRQYPCEVFDFRDGKHLIDAAYVALCWCINEGYLKVGKEDEP